MITIKKQEQEHKKIVKTNETWDFLLCCRAATVARTLHYTLGTERRGAGEFKMKMKIKSKDAGYLKQTANRLKKKQNKNILCTIIIT